MKTISRLKQFEKVLMIEKQKPLFIFTILVPGYVDKEVGFEGGESDEEREQLLRAKYPSRYLFLDNDNNVEVLTEYLKTKGIIFPGPGKGIHHFLCDYETITVGDEVIPYQELEPFLTPERGRDRQI